MSVAAVIPTIPPRQHVKLARALASVAAQTRPVDWICVATDFHHQGAGPTRNAAMEEAIDLGAEWVAFLDDDDEWLPHHIETCLRIADETGADVVVPWCVYDGFGDPPPLQDVRNIPIGTRQMHQFMITCLVRVAAIGDLRFEPPVPREVSRAACEDLTFWTELQRRGARFEKRGNEETWIWHFDGQNTSGRGDRWIA